jgi:TetR/AcrR family transcriptional regulator
MAESNTGRRQQILEVLAAELEAKPTSRLTTASLAKAVGVTEAALYRHFPSKGKMFEALIDFADESVFTLTNRILAENRNPVIRCEQILRTLLVFAERNPGITRILIGDALSGESERLQKRVLNFFERLETQLKQVLREANLGDGARAKLSIAAAANLMMAVAEGRMSRFVRSGFAVSVTAHWGEQWDGLREALFA